MWRNTAAPETIAAIATPAGAGGVGVIRISGTDLRTFAAILAVGKLPPPRVAARARFVDDGGVIDDGLVLYFPAPHSFTGEDVLELHGHGGVFVLQRLLSCCFQLGARQARAGEFTLRAYLNDKLDLTQAEALADVISAGSEAAARAAARSMHGEFSTLVGAFSDSLRSARVKLESSLDFSDDDAQAPTAELAVAVLDCLTRELETLLARTRRGVLLTDGAEVVIVGAPNVGKSSLLNALCGEEAAIVTAQPGTTRDIVSRRLEIGGVPLSLSDGAGLRETNDPIELEGIARLRRRLQSADLVLSISITEVPPVIDERVANRTICVRNKIDLSGEAAGERDGVVYVSAKTGAGVDAVRAVMLRAMGGDEYDNTFSARERHVTLLEKTLSLLRRAQESAAMPEVAAAWLHDAEQQAQQITGIRDDEDLLGDIFSKFCVGK